MNLYYTGQEVTNDKKQLQLLSKRQSALHLQRLYMSRVVTTENVILPENEILVTFSGAIGHHSSRKCNTSFFIQQV